MVASRCRPRSDPDGQAFDPHAAAVEPDAHLAAVGVDGETICPRAESRHSNLLDALLLQPVEGMRHTLRLLLQGGPRRGAVEEAGERLLALGPVEGAQAAALQAQLQDVAQVAEELLRQLAVLHRVTQSGVPLSGCRVPPP